MIMEHEDLIELLAAHADQLNSGATHDTEYLQMYPSQRQELFSLLRLAERVKDALAPVKPAPAYKRKLGLDLTDMAHQRVSRDMLVAPPSPRRELIIGAAIGSAMAVAGGIAYLLRTHIQTRSQRVGQVQT